MSKKRLTLKQAGEYSPAVLKKKDISMVRQVARVTFDVANKRIKSLKEAGLYEVSPAIYDLGEHAKFSSKGLTKSELIVEIQRARLFINNKSSLVSFSHKFRDEIITGLKNDDRTFMRDLTVDDWTNIHQTVYDLHTQQGGWYYSTSDTIMLAANIIRQKPEISQKDLLKQVKNYSEVMAAMNKPTIRNDPLLTLKVKT